MSRVTIAISLDSEILGQIDHLVEEGLFPSRSKLIQGAVAEKLVRLRWTRLSEECGKLRPLAERAAAEKWLQGEAEWPEY